MWALTCRQMEYAWQVIVKLIALWEFVLNVKVCIG